MADPYKVLIVDDEPPARRKIAHFLSAEPRFEVIAEAGNGEQALNQIAIQRPDLIFLDIHMPGMNGFEMLTHLETEDTPHLIFTTAYDQYALAAFEAHALDYLLKPFDRTRFAAALIKATTFLDGKTNEPSKVQQLREELQPQKSRPARLLIKDGRGLQTLRLSEVLQVQAEEKYVRLITKTGHYLHRETMANLEAKLDPESFARINRSTIIHISQFKELQTNIAGEYLVILQDGTEQTLGRTWRNSFLTWLEHAP